MLKVILFLSSGCFSDGFSGGFSGAFSGTFSAGFGGLLAHGSGKLLAPVVAVPVPGFVCFCIVAWVPVGLDGFREASPNTFCTGFVLRSCGGVLVPDPPLPLLEFDPCEDLIGVGLVLLVGVLMPKRFWVGLEAVDVVEDWSSDFG